MWFKYSPKKHLVTFFLQEDIEIPIPKYFIQENLGMLQYREKYLHEILLNAGLLEQVNVPHTYIGCLVCLVHSHVCLNTRHWSEKCFYSSEEVKRNLRFPCQIISSHTSRLGRTAMVLLCFLCVRVSERAALWPNQCFVCLTNPLLGISPADALCRLN